MRVQENQEEWDGVEETELRWNKACHGGVEGSMGAKLKEAYSQSETPAWE